jgi:hypothetical protein
MLRRMGGPFTAIRKAVCARLLDNMPVRLTFYDEEYILPNDEV